MCSIEQIQLREKEKQQKTNASLDGLHQQINTFHPASSCAAVLQLYSSSPLGYYSIRSSNGTPVDVYSDMTLSCGGITGGWRKVAELDMTNNNIVTSVRALSHNVSILTDVLVVQALTQLPVLWFYWCY